jgi:hypothetical protein
MDTLFEQRVTQNTALTAFAIHQAVLRFDQHTQGTSGLELFAAILIPPLVFHRRTAESLAAKQMTEGLFFRAITDDRELIVGVQSRVMAMASQTFKAIHLGCSARVFQMHHEPRIQLVPLIRSLPQEVDGIRTIAAVRTVFAAAKRLGYCFANTDFAVICAALKVRF